MKQSKLEEIKRKFENNDSELADVINILTEMFISQSQHFRALKNELATLKENHEVLYNELHDLKNNLNPVYQIVYTDEDLEEN